MRPSSPLRSRRGRAVLIALAAMVGTLAVVPTASAAEDPVRTSASSTYTAVPDKGIVKVNVTLKVTNRYANSVSSKACERQVWDEWLGEYVTVPTTCTTTTRYYVNQDYLWVEGDALNLKVTSSAGAVKKSKSKESTGEFTAYKLTFPKIFNGQTRTIKATYTLKSGKPRTDATTRVNGGYLNVWGFTQPTDEASAKVIVPASFDAYAWGDDVKESTNGGKRTYSTGKVKKIASVGVTGTDPEGFDESIIKSAAGREIRIQAWPGDTEWMTAVKASVAGSISELEDLIGHPVPGSEPIVVREVTSSDLGEAYAGSYDEDTHIASVSENFQQAGLVTHELAHAWFHGGMFDAQWLSEGYADWAEQAIAPGTTKCIAPSTIGTTIDLGEWQFADPRATAEQKAAVHAQYDAACAIVSGAAATIGADRMDDVLDVLSTEDGAYPGTIDSKVGAPNDWKQWLDAIDERGSTGATDPSDDIDDLLVRFGIADQATLTDRATTRTDLKALRTLAGTTWTIPVAVNKPMRDWDFDAAGVAIEKTSVAINDIAATAAALPTIAVELNPLTAELASADSVIDLGTLQGRAMTQRRTAEIVAATAAQVDAVNPIEAIGLIGTDLDPITASAITKVGSMDIEGAESDDAVIESNLQGATASGVIRIALTLLALVTVVAILWVVRRRRSTRLATSPAAVMPSITADPSIDETPRA